MTSSERAQHVAEIVKSALERTAEDARLFLEQACAGDAETRAEVHSLLSFQKQASGFIEQGALNIAAEALAQNGLLAREQVIGGYKIVSKIGAGGMGDVYLAEDIQLRRKVALKLVRAAMSTDDIVARFRHEEQILASLNDPNIAHLYGGGVTANGIPFFVMEYVEGLRIDEYCDRRDLTTEARLQLFRKVCSAVHYAHQHLVIHRDLKPSNILVTETGEPKLLDFGIAKLLKADESAPAMTLVGVMTPDYASPEQVRGESITTASDVYSLGVVLYALLTGQRPYRTKTNRPDEIARAITEQEPARPSTAAIRGCATSPKSLRGDLDNIILMALRKEPQRRYSSVGQFSDDIRRYLDGLPVIARKDTFAYRSSKFVKRHRVGLAAVLLILLGLIGGIVVSVRQTRVAQRETAKAEATSDFLQAMLAAFSPESQLRQQKDDLRVKDVLDEASKRLSSEELSNQPEVKAELQRIIGATYLTLGQYDLASKNLAAALSAQNRIYGEESVESLKTLVIMAEVWMSKGNNQQADRFYQKTLPVLRVEQKKGTISADYLITALGDFAMVRRAQGDSKEAELLLREELALGLQVSPNAKSGLGVARAVLALTLVDQGKFDEAIGMIRTQLATIREQSKSETPELCATLTGLGSFLMERGDPVEAEEHLHEAETGYRKLYNHSNLQLGDNLRLQAQALYLEHKYREAEAKIGETLEIYRATTNANYINFPTALMVQGLIYGETQRTLEAEKLLREAVRIRSENMPETNFLRATATGALGEFLTTQRRFSEAEPLLLNSYESLKKSQNASSPRMRLALQRLVELYEKWQKPDLAARYRQMP